MKEIKYLNFKSTSSLLRRRVYACWVLSLQWMLSFNPEPSACSYTVVFTHISSHCIGLTRCSLRVLFCGWLRIRDSCWDDVGQF
jgi:hypothetical protein